MKKITLLLLGATCALSAGAQIRLGDGQLSGSFETNSIYYVDDAKMTDVAGYAVPEDRFGSNNYLKLDYRLGRFSAGIQAEWYPQVLQGYENKLDGFGLPEKYLAWTDRHWSITLGDFYEQCGSGLVLRAWEDRALGFNNSLGGGRVTFDIGEVLQGKALFGFPRYYMEGFDSYSSTQVAAGDLSLSLSNALGWKGHSFALEGSLVNRHESGHPADYTEEVPVQFIQFTVEENHPWAGSKIRDILLPPETLLVQIQRDEKDVTPNGDTVLVPGDTLILSAKAPGDVDGVRLIEIELDGSHKWVGKSLSRIHLGKGKLVVMIQRGEELIIPNGNTVFAPGDTIVIKER